MKEQVEYLLVPCSWTGMDKEAARRLDCQMWRDPEWVRVYHVVVTAAVSLKTWQLANKPLTATRFCSRVLPPPPQTVVGSH